MSLTLKTILGQVNNISFLVNENFDRLKNAVLLKDGSEPMQGNLDMNGKQILNVDGIFITGTSGNVASADALNQAVDAASTSANDAHLWATSPEDSQVTDSQGRSGYSALHYSNKAEQHANSAQASASNAATSESNALSYLNDFKGRYYGAYSSDPATDPLGNPVDTGDVYYNTAEGKLKYWTGGTWDYWSQNADTLDGYHASSFLQASSYTASDILTKIKTVDGAGSGLDADTVDGKHRKEIIAPPITYLSKSGYNGQAFLIDGRLYTASGTNAHYDSRTTGVFNSGANLRFGIMNMHNVNFPEPETNKIKKVGGFFNAYAFALFENGNLYTWGFNSNGQCGLGHVSAVINPTLAATGVIDAFDNPSQGEYSVNSNRLFILKSDGLYAAGYNGGGQLGVGDATNRSVFTKCVGLTNTSDNDIVSVWAIGCSSGFTFVHTADGKIWFAGTNNTGVAGNGTTTNATSFIDVTQYWVTLGKTLESIKVTGGSRYYTTFAADSKPVVVMLLKYTDGTSEVKCAGNNKWGSLGDGTTTNRTTPVNPLNVPTDGSVIDIAGFGSSPLTVQTLTSNGDLYAWGHNNSGQVGDGATAHRTTPIVVATGVLKLFSDGMTSLQYGYRVHSFIKKSDGLYMCGYNGGAYYAGMGVNVTSNILTYQKVLLPDDDNDVIDIGHTASKSHRRAILVLTSKGNLYVWGYNGDKQVHDTTTNHVPVPQLVTLPKPFNE